MFSIPSIDKKKSLKILYGIKKKLKINDFDYYDTHLSCEKIGVNNFRNIGEVNKFDDYHKITALAIKIGNQIEENEITDTNIGQILENVQNTIQNDVNNADDILEKITQISIYEIDISECEKKIDTHMYLFESSYECDSVYMDFVYNNYIGNWVHFDKYDKMLIILDFSKYCDTIKYSNNFTDCLITFSS